MPGRAIATAVAKAYGITLKDLKSVRQWRYIAHARQHAMYLMRKHTKLSTTLISKTLGRSDHTTAVHGIRAHCKRHGLEVPRNDFARPLLARRKAGAATGLPPPVAPLPPITGKRA